MHSVLTKVLDMIESRDDLNFNTVAGMIGCTKQELSNMRTNGCSFRKLLRLSYVLTPENQKEVMYDWCMKLNTTEAIKQGFEYASITRNKKLLHGLLETHKEDRGELSKYVAVYTVLLDFYNNKISAGDILDRIEKVGKTKGELLILVEIIKCYNYYFAGKYHLMLETAKEAEKSVYKLGSRQQFIKECYIHRLAEVLGHVSLLLNDRETARYYANLIINADICAKTVSGAYYIVGMTFLNEGSIKAVEYLRTRYEIACTIGEQDIESNARRDLDFAKIYLNIQLDADADPLLRKLQEQKASEFELNTIKEATYCEGDDDLLILIRAAAKKSITKMNECRKKFFNDAKYFFASLAAQEVKNLGEQSAMIDEFIEFKINTKGDVLFEENFIGSFTSYHDGGWTLSA
ncbi:AimR family lysis-lysogeny pheromone receptor [Mesobacillus zeae]|uniref:Prophage helix-turn-helix protein n=1 Tax=Mesobacillus zeae TaxID=1917180 RepID=A0A398BHA4_9BACI|nr:AimR family lysis-lysogeny pheromone receptor [Mesobacillus zeae]RID88994.1 hypothetical protein D1970_00390 [Mesobacillus zeae]